MELEASKPKQERITVDASVREKLERLTAQANEALQGIATVSKSDLVTLVIQAHAEALSKTEIENLRAAHFDDLKFAEWLKTKLSEARSQGQELSLLDLIERSRSVLVQVKARPQMRSRRKTRKKPGFAEPAVETQPDAPEGQQP